MNDEDVIGGYIDGGLNIMSASLSLVNPAFGMIAIGAQPLLAKKLKQFLSSMVNKSITKREFTRLDKAIDGMTTSIEANLNDKMPLNNLVMQQKEDGFTDADDLFEEMLRQIKNETESKKSYFCGIFIGNIPYSGNLSSSNLLQYEKIISQLSYSHLCLLKVLDNLKGSGQNRCGRADSYVLSNPIPDVLEVYSELMQLKTFGLVKCVPPFNLGAQLGNIEISDFGVNLCKLMRLNLLEKEDVSKTLSIVENFK